MSDDSNSPAEEAIAKWAETVASAAPWGEAWEQLSELERRVVSLVHNAAVTLNIAREGLADERDQRWLEELVAIKEDRSDTVKLALAAQIIGECAEKSTPALGDLPSTDGVDWARLCLGMLASEVHPDFSKAPTEDVEHLLARYTNTMDRQGGKLTSAGILVEINALAGHPFGRSLNSKHVNDATRRAL